MNSDEIYDKNENRTTCWMDLRPFIRKSDVSLKSEIFFFRVSARWRGTWSRRGEGERSALKSAIAIYGCHLVWITCECCTRALHRIAFSQRFCVNFDKSSQSPSRPPSLLSRCVLFSTEILFESLVVNGL